jgi:outer membrane protein assembly factor BamB
MRYILHYESFKVKNITSDDIRECIKKGGILYATIINNFPDNDPEIPLKPLSVDEDGTVTVDYNGSIYEVDLDNIDKIEWQSND